MATLSFLRFYVHEWTGLRPGDWANRVLQIVERQEFYEPAERTGDLWVWAVSDPAIIQRDGDTLISGVLHKIRKNAIERIWDPNAWNVRRGIPGVYAAEAAAPFTISVQHHIIAHEVTAVQQRHFVAALRAVLSKGGASAPAMNAIIDRRRFFERLDQLERITSLAAKVKPTNPIDKEAIARADGILKESDAEWGTFHFRSRKGLNIRRGTILASILNLATEGYGHGDVTGVERGTGLQQRVRTDDQGIRIRIDGESLEEIRTDAIGLIPAVANYEDEPPVGRRGNAY